MINRPLKNWTADNTAEASQQLRVLLNTDAYDRIAAALR
jgi:hypothetical protein